MGNVELELISRKGESKEFWSTNQYWADLIPAELERLLG